MTVNVELFISKGCRQCASARTELQQTVEAVGEGRMHWRIVQVLEEIDYAVQLGVFSIPAIAIDGELVFSSLPSRKRLREALEQRMRGART